MVIIIQNFTREFILYRHEISENVRDKIIHTYEENKG